MRPLKYIPRYTVDDYRLWEGDWELIDGIPYAMSPSPVRKHQQLALQLVTQVNDSLKRLKDVCGNCSVVYKLDWNLDNSTVLRPNIAIVCNNTGDYITKAPVLIIEILSPSTAFKDRQVKFDIYEEQGVKYYLMVDPDTKIYNVYVLINGKYVEQKNFPELNIHEGCIIPLDIATAWAGL